MSLIPIHYDLHLEPDLENFKFRGITTIKAKVEGPVTSVNLHAFELEFNNIEADFGSGFKAVEKYQLDFDKQMVEVIFTEPSPNEFSLRFTYIGEHNDKLAGFYRSKFKVDGEDKYCVVTQFQANDARRAFPCIDVPGNKASFDIEFLTDPEYLCISNMPIKSEEVKGEKKLVKFDRTPVMSTYLLFFGVGNFGFISTRSGKIDYRLIAAPGKAEKHGKFSLDFGVKVIEFCEKYFAFDYPLPKLDQIATPDFAAGAMENWGAILYRENALLHYEGITSKLQENRILGVVAHELAHQWFGNLVSPVTWKYIWLNESFATFFANVVLDHYYPERKIWQFFVQSVSAANRSRSTSGVIDWDSMIETSPIEIAGEGEISFTAKTVPIIYTKGGSILRQIKAFLGDDGFRDGLRAYFKKHAYSATKSNNLWESLEEVTGMPVTSIMESFILKKGVPIINVSHEGGKLRFTQKRFTYLDHEDDTVWTVPITIRLFKDGRQELQRFVLDKREDEFEVTDFDYYKLNADLTGFYRVQYPSSYYDKLGELIRGDMLSDIDRMHIEEDVFSLLKAGMIDIDTYLDMLEYYLDETSYMCINNLTLHLNDIRKLLPDGARNDRIIQFGKKYFDSVFDKIGYHAKEGEDIGISIIRGNVLSISALFGVDQSRNFALGLFDKLKNNEPISADLRATVYVMGARYTNDFDWFMKKFNNPESESEFINSIMGLCSFTDKELLGRVQAMVFNEIPARNRGFAITSLAANNVISDDIWFWYLANLDGFEALNNFMFQGSIVAVIRNSLKHKKDMNTHFEEFVKKKPKYQDAVDVGLEQLNITLAFKGHLDK